MTEQLMVMSVEITPKLYFRNENHAMLFNLLMVELQVRIDNPEYLDYYGLTKEKIIEKVKEIYYAYAFIEAYVIHNVLVYRKYNDKDLSIFLQMEFSMLYLLGYTLIEEQILKPLVVAINPGADISVMRDKDLLKTVGGYKDGKYSVLFDFINPNLRNAIAHIQYFMADDILQYFDKDSGDNKPLAGRGMELISMYSKFENILDDIRTQIPVFMGVAQIINQLFYKKEWSSEVVVSGQRVIFNEQMSDFFEIILSAMIIDDICMGNRNQHDLSIYNQLESTIDNVFIWSTVFIFLHRFEPGLYLSKLQKIIDFLEPNQHQIVWCINTLYHLLQR